MDEINNLAYKNLLEGIILCLTNLSYIKNYFNGNLIEDYYNCCNNTNQMALTCALKELINGLNSVDLLDFSLNIFVQKYDSMVNYNFENNSENIFTIISNLIEQLHKEQNFIGNNNYNSQNQPFSIEVQKSLMLGLFYEYFENTNVSEISKLFFGSSIIIRECSLCNSFTYNFEIQKVFKFDLDKIISFKNNNNENENLVSLDDCFKFYCSINKDTTNLCKKENCYNSEIKTKKLIYWTSDIIVISLQRNSFEENKIDFKIDTTFNISPYVDKDSLNNLTKFFNRKMDYKYELNSIFYFDGSDYLSLCRKNKNVNKWYYIHSQSKSEDFEDISEELKQFVEFQPFLLF